MATEPVGVSSAQAISPAAGCTAEASTVTSSGPSRKIVSPSIDSSA
ncbi:hypothetical protein [Streptomyces sp. NPDC006971]